MQLLANLLVGWCSGRADNNMEGGSTSYWYLVPRHEPIGDVSKLTSAI